MAAELRTGNPTLFSAVPPRLCDLDPNHSTSWSLVSLCLSPPPPPTLPPLTLAKLFQEIRVSLSSSARPHKRKALLASLLLNINNGISIVYYKPEKEVPRALGEMAKRIIRPFRPQTFSGPQVKLERQMRFPLQQPLYSSMWLLLAPHNSCSFQPPAPHAMIAFPPASACPGLFQDVPPRPAPSLPTT